MNRRNRSHFVSLALVVSALSFGCGTTEETPSSVAPPAAAPEEPSKGPPPALAPPRPNDEESLPSSATIWMTPHDGAVTASPVVRLGVRGLPVRRGVRALRAVAPDVRLLTWPELAPIDARVEVAPPDAYAPGDEVDATATVIPAAPLAPRAYVLAVGSPAVRLAPVLARDTTTLADGRLAVRFEVTRASADVPVFK